VKNVYDFWQNQLHYHLHQYKYIHLLLLLRLVVRQHKQLQDDDVNDVDGLLVVCHQHKHILLVVIVELRQVDVVLVEHNKHHHHLLDMVHHVQLVRLVERLFFQLDSPEEMRKKQIECFFTFLEKRNRIISR
jgi:hypothetical protein